MVVKKRIYEIKEFVDLLEKNTSPMKLEDLEEKGGKVEEISKSALKEFVANLSGKDREIGDRERPDWNRCYRVYV